MVYTHTVNPRLLFFLNECCFYLFSKNQKIGHGGPPQNRILRRTTMTEFSKFFSFSICGREWFGVSRWGVRDAINQKACLWKNVLTSEKKGGRWCFWKRPFIYKLGTVQHPYWVITLVRVLPYEYYRYSRGNSMTVLYTINISRISVEDISTSSTRN
jgi:hypothetical protein